MALMRNTLKYIFSKSGIILLLVVNLFPSATYSQALKDKKVKELTITVSYVPPDGSYHPGCSFKIGITAITDEGVEMNTKGLLNGNLEWENYRIKVSGGSFSNGEVTIFNDPRMIDEYKVTISAASFFDSTISRSITLQVSFKSKFTLSFEGADGASGKKGDQNDNKSYGTGGNGENGKDGQDVEVSISAFKDSNTYSTSFNQGNGLTLLKVYVKSIFVSEGDTFVRNFYYVIDPNGGSLRINSKGGNGGNGGNGSRGGNGGNGGNGGAVTLYVDTSAKAYVSCIEVSNAGGRYGLKGKRSNIQSIIPGTANISSRDTKIGKSGVNGKDGLSGRVKRIIYKPLTIHWANTAK